MALRTAALLRAVVEVVCVLLLITSGKETTCFSEDIPFVGVNSTSTISTDGSLSGQVHQPTVNSQFLGIFNYSNQTMSNRLLARDMAEYICGSAGLCRPNEKKFGEVCNFECPRCRCDERCHFYGDCCPDELFHDSEVIPSTRPEYITCAVAEKTKWRNETSIFMVTKCPNGTSAADIAKKCESPDIAELSQATPVSDMSRELVYANEFCALCHGIRVYETWTQTVTCSVAIDLKGATSRSALWRLVVTERSCDRRVISLPPEGFEIRPCALYATGNCNVTGKWLDNHDPVVDQLCELFEGPVVYNKGTSSRTYRNHFCAVCNGEPISPNTFCGFGKNIGPPPISVLLQFNPSPPVRKAKSRDATNCAIGQVLDPITTTCRRPSCPPRRILEADVCEVPYLTTEGVGYSFAHTLRIASNNNSIEHDFSEFTAYYIDDFHAFFQGYEPFLYLDLELEFWERNSMRRNDSAIDFVKIVGKFMSKSNRSVEEMEVSLMDFTSASFTYQHGNETAVFNSSILSCPEIMDNYELIGRKKETDIAPELRQRGTFSPLVAMDCAYFEYDLSATNFTYSPNTSIAVFGEREIYLNITRLLYCNNTLKVCIDLINEISDLLNRSAFDEINTQPKFDRPLQIVSFVCIILSLIALFVTFLIYCVLPKLRTAPGRNAMALVFHLFWAQLLFLALSSLTDNDVLCSIFGILIHYFWMTTFAWMMASAFQMYKTFSGFPAVVIKVSTNRKLIWKYLLVCDILSLLPPGVCLTYHLIKTDATELGYGGSICFISEPWAVGAFFAGPLCLMLLFNGFCFTRIIMSIGCRPNIENSHVIYHANYAFIYIKLSLLFGFTWIFGLLAAIFDNNVLWYFFVILTGSQGVFLFVSYCVNSKTWSSVKTTLSERSSTRSFELSRKTS